MAVRTTYHADSIFSESDWTEYNRAKQNKLLFFVDQRTILERMQQPSSDAINLIMTKRHERAEVFDTTNFVRIPTKGVSSWALRIFESKILFAVGRRTAWLCSEKLDGIRMIWTGNRMFTKQGVDVSEKLPLFWLNSFPPGVALDMEMWAGHHNRGVCSSVLNSKTGTHSDNWSKIRFCIHDLIIPEMDAIGRYSILCEWIKRWTPQLTSLFTEINPIDPPLTVVKQTRVYSKDEMLGYFSGLYTSNIFPEGAIAKLGKAPYQPGITRTVIKIKPVVMATGKAVAAPFVHHHVGSPLYQETGSARRVRISWRPDLSSAQRDVLATVPDNMVIHVGQIVVFWFHQVSAQKQSVYTAMCVKLKDVHMLGPWKLHVGNATDYIQTTESIFGVFRLHTKDAVCASAQFSPVSCVGAVWVYPTIKGGLSDCLINSVLYPKLLPLEQLNPNRKYNRFLPAVSETTEDDAKPPSRLDDGSVARQLLAYCHKTGPFGTIGVVIVLEVIKKLRLFTTFCNKNGQTSEIEIHKKTGMPTRCGQFKIETGDDTMGLICLSYVAYIYIETRSIINNNSGKRFPLELFVSKLMHCLNTLDRMWSPLHTSVGFTHLFVQTFHPYISDGPSKKIKVLLATSVATRQQQDVGNLDSVLEKSLLDLKSSLSTKAVTIDTVQNEALMCDPDNWYIVRSLSGNDTLSADISYGDIVCSQKIKVDSNFLPVIPFGAQCDGNRFVSSVIRGTTEYVQTQHAPTLESQLNTSYIRQNTERLLTMIKSPVSTPPLIFKNMEDIISFIKNVD